MARDSTIDLAEVARCCACSQLRRTARVVTQLYDAALEPSGVLATQFPILVALALADGAPLGRIADRLAMDRTTLTRNLRPLQRKGWIQAEQGPDRRERSLSLTRAGRAALDRALPLWKSVQAEIVGRVGSARWSALQGEFEILLAAARGASPPAS